MGNQKRIQATLVSHTHWDRAWYMPYQEFRVRLVRLVDRLLEILRTNPDFGVFMLDGQMCVMEDYLQVRPLRAAELQALCQSGRIQIGPWYILADEFLSSPEALIRNLMWGHRMGLPYGGVMQAGYVPDGFGHIAQLPQILRGFGIDSAFFWRGMGAEGDRLGSEFEWAAPDGASVTAILMPYGYHNISNLGYGIHWGDTSQLLFSAELAQEQICLTLEQLKPFAHTATRLLMNGIDHAEAEPRLPQIIARANQELEDVHVTQGTLLDHLRRVRASGVKLPRFAGEFRWGRYSEVLQGVYSTRIYLKQANQRVETLLERYMEPLAAFAWLGGASIPEGKDDLIWMAWRMLIQSHAHDDMYGSVVDQTSRETLQRIGQAEQIGRALLLSLVRALALQVNCNRQAAGMPLLVYNPLNQTRCEVAVGEVDFDLDDQALAGMQVVDGDGKAAPHQVLADLGEQTWMEVNKANHKRRLRIAIQADVPGCGHRVYFVRGTSEARAAGRSQPMNLPTPVFDANEFHRLTIAGDGTPEIEDLPQGGARYTGLHYFEDVEDAGDGYSYAPCAQSQTLSTRGKPVRVELLRQGLCITTWRVEQRLALPLGLSPDRQQRSAEMVDTPIVSEISLYAGQPGVYILTEIDNRARDHKLSVVFPTRMNPAAAVVDESFTTVARPVDLPPAPGWVEDPTPLMHQRAFTDLSEGKHGLAVLNRGLPLVEVRRAEGGTQISLQLLRATGWLSRGDLSTRQVVAGPMVEAPEAQCLGRQRFEYTILPHAGEREAVYPLAYAYVTPLLVERADTFEGDNLPEMNMTGNDPTKAIPLPWRREGPLPDILSFLTVEPQALVLSAVRRTADGLGLVGRAYNNSVEAVNGRITCWKPPSEAWCTNLNEERQSPLEVKDEKTVELPVKGGEVVTVELRF